MSAAAGTLLFAMRLLVLMCLVIAAAMQMQAASGAPPTAAKLAHCLKSCGDANISYPYGVGAGCFRPGFELTCDHSTKPPKLLLLANTTNGTTTKIVDQYTYGYVQASVSFNIATTPGVMGTYNRTWESPDRILSIRPDFHALVAVGCGIEVYLVDPDTEDVLGNCFSTCTDMAMMHKEAEGKACSGMGCCVVTVRRTVRAFRVSIIQREETQPFEVANASTIKVFLSEEYATYHYNFTLGDLLSDEINETTVASTSADLLTIITDQPNCTIAQKDPERYACGDNKCLDADDENGGYRCACINKFSISNPYLDGDCDQETEYNPSRDRKNCSRICGNASIPFPFGLEEGCSGNKRLQLSCVANQTRIGTSPTQYLVTNISLDDAELVVSRPSSLGDNRTHVYEVEDDISGGWTVSLIEDLESFDFSEQYGVLKWAITNVTCEKAKSDTDSYACVSAMSECLIVTTGSGRLRVGYRCKCSAGYQGNPYVKNGCQERKYASTKQHSLFYGVAIGLICGFSVLALVISSIALVKRWKRRIQMKIRRAYFRRNKGMILEQLISSDESIAHNTKIFSLEELEKATNNFDSTRIVGHGGHGTVYKGILSDQRVVAIKRSKIVEQTEVDQFVNEVAILSQVIHRNVVKLYGCCLESEVPLLVYQFISNGTLYDLLHGDLNKKCLLTWGDRIRIALEAARAISYLHYAASIPIFHRDVKSGNILLDDNFITKVSDFGASRSVSIDETHVVTIVQGTFGYLDPEYYHTGKLNEKSDVYSFGVILIELLTRKRPIFLSSMGDKQNLCHHFLQRQEHKTTVEIVDPQVLEEADQREIYEMASLAEMCLKLMGEERPTMKEVELRLQLLWGQLTKKSQEEPLYTCKSACLTQYVDLATDANLVAHDATRCYTMEQELVSWTSLPR